MSGERVERRLAAILAADVAGYSRLMGLDEAGTLARLKALRRDLIDPEIAEHMGRVVKTTGDGLLIEFPSVVEAVACAVAVQQSMGLHNSSTPADQRIEFRVGINTGDVIVEDGDIHGDGVNVAARLEALAEPGGICVSAIVHEQVQGRLDCAFEDTGEQNLKNIARPVRVYRVLADCAAPAAGVAVPAARRRAPRWAITAAGIAALVVLAAGAAAFWRLHPVQLASPPAATTATATRPPLPDKPSIAVLPFANLSGDPAQDYLGDGLTENLLDALAQNPALFVIARGATQVYRGKEAAPRAVAKDLGVHYVLEGTVQKSGERIRVTAQLIDAVTDNHLLSQKYDRTLTDLFEVEDDLTLQIAGALDVRLTGTWWARVTAGGTRNLEAWENLAKADRGVSTPADMSETQKRAQRAVDLDPNYTQALFVLAFTYFRQADFGWVKDPPAAFDRARQLDDKVLQLDPEFAGAYAVRARLEVRWELLESDFEAALADARKSVELGPNIGFCHWTLGFVLYQLGHFDEATAEFATALRLEPQAPLLAAGFHGVALSAAGHHEEAIAEIEAAIAANPKNPLGPWYRGRVELWAGNYAEAARSFERARELDPDLAQYAYFLAEADDLLGRVEDAISLLEKGPRQWRSAPMVQFWLAMSYALAGRKDQAAAEFAAFRALAPKYTVAIAQRGDYAGYFAPKFFDRIAALLREYGIPEK
jgi:adenylate cyclase